MAPMDEVKAQYGPSEVHDPLVLQEGKRAAVWIGMIALAALTVVLIQPILLIVAGMLVAVILDGGTRLFGRWLPIPRGLRLTIIVLLLLGFIVATVWLGGQQIVAQFGQLRQALEVQGARLSVLMSQYDLLPGDFNLSAMTGQLSRTVGVVTSMLGAAFGGLTSLFLIFVIGLFLAIDPGTYLRGVVWLFPRERRDEATLLFQRVGFTMRRLFAGRLLGMAFEGTLTWLLLLWGGVPLASLLGILSAVLAFIPNVGAFITGLLMLAVGFSAGMDTGLWALGTYVVVQTVDGYVLIPIVAKKTVDLPPALTLSAQVLFATLFGLLGLAIADPITAAIKVFLHREAEKEAEGQGDDLSIEPLGSDTASH